MLWPLLVYEQVKVFSPLACKLPRKMRFYFRHMIFFFFICYYRNFPNWRWQEMSLLLLIWSILLKYSKWFPHTLLQHPLNKYPGASVWLGILFLAFGAQAHAPGNFLAIALMVLCLQDQHWYYLLPMTCRNCLNLICTMDGPEDQ